MSAMKTHVGRGSDDGDETTERESSVGLRPDPFPRTAVAGGNVAGSGLDSRLTVYRWGNTIIHSGRSNPNVGRWKSSWSHPTAAKIQRLVISHMIL
ncbi:hypothetical protein SAY86_018327 [Trapa natans]|uniref:Uncharacterized protein n=1 Tax=Trapa natans TaxID=22666 RepID=A0AAN7LGP9_TRANT|nr:hypothetical protein SAY86_018327 [Trapa natans]